MQIFFDYSSVDTHQPGQYEITDISGIAGYGASLYGTAVYGGTADFSKRILLEGSGFSNKFIFNSQGSGGPYSINSLYVDMRVGALL